MIYRSYFHFPGRSHRAQKGAGVLPKGAGVLSTVRSLRERGARN